MDLTSSWVLLLVVVLGGVIALYADRLGRNLGKKRLKLGSLRPRRTAEVIVFGAGMLTPLLAILAIMAASAEARQWILRGYTAVREARNAITQKDNAIRELERLKARARDLDFQLKDLDERQKRLLKQSNQFEKNAHQAETRAKAATNRAQGLETRVGSLNTELLARRAALGNVQGTLDNAREDLRRLRQSYGAAEKQLRQAEDEVLRLGKEIDSLNDQIKTGQGDLSSVRGLLKQAQQDLKEAEEARTAAVNKFQADISALNRQLEDVQGALNLAQRNTFQLAQKWLFEPLSFRRGEEIARQPTEKQLSQSEAERSLDIVLRMARMEASKRGARADQRGLEAGLVDLPQSDGSLRTIEQQRAQIVRRLTGQSDESVVIANVPLNSFGDQFVPVVVNVLPNPVVFKSGELLGEMRIDGSNSIGRLFEQIGELLRDQVRKKAESKNMIPIAGREDVYGSVSPDEIFFIISSIQNFGRPARLQVLAKEDTRAAGPLALDFRLR